MKNSWMLLLALVAALLVGCAPKEPTPDTPPAEETTAPEGDDHAAHQHEVGPNGGMLAILGGHEFHVEVLPDEKTETVDAIVSDGEFKPFPIESPELKINAVVEGAPKQFVLARVASTEEGPAKFALQDADLVHALLHREGVVQVAIGINDVPYSAPLAEMHEDEDHDEHAEESHEGHDHE